MKPKLDIQPETRTVGGSVVECKVRPQDVVAAEVASDLLAGRVLADERPRTMAANFATRAATASAAMREWRRSHPRGVASSNAVSMSAALRRGGASAFCGLGDGG